MTLIVDQLDVIKEHQKRPPVYVVPIANRIGLRVLRIKPGKWPDHLSGVLRRSPVKPEKFNIYVNGSHHPHRRRFTIAHEIAHFILHAR